MVWTPQQDKGEIVPWLLDDPTCRPVCVQKYITSPKLSIYLEWGMDGGDWWNGRSGTVSLIYQWLCDTRQHPRLGCPLPELMDVSRSGQSAR